MVGKFIKTLPITLIVVVVLLVVVIAGGLTGFSTWPFLFVLFYYTTFAGMDIKKVLPLAIWGALGMFGGYLSPLFGESVGTILLLVYLVLLLNCALSQVPTFDPICFLLLTLTTAVPGLCTKEALVKDWLGFCLGVVLMIVIGGLAGIAAKKAAAKNPPEAK